MRKWEIIYTPRAKQQRLMLNLEGRRLADAKLRALAEKPWLWGEWSADTGRWTTRFGWYGIVVYTIAPERHGLIIQDCRWRPPEGHPDHPVARDKRMAGR